LIPSVKHINFDLTFWASFAFGEADFHKIKDREASRSHDLNTTDDNAVLTESFSTWTELQTVCMGIKIFGF
jgi:hypothetical protein